MCSIRLWLYTLVGLLIASHVVADDLLPPEHSVEQAIDHYVGARLKSEQVTPAAEASAQVLRRRTMLDLVGRIPTAAESKGGLDGAQRVALVDQLMSTPAFDRHQADEFDAMLMHDVGDSLRDYLRQAFQAKRPWNEIFKDVIVGEPEDAKQQGAIKYVRSRVGDLDKLANKVSSDFFGVNVSCARCHDHPEAAEWTQAHFFGMKSFFNRTFDNGGLIGERSYGLVEYKTTAGESRTAKLMFLTGAVVEEPEPKSLTDAEKKAEKKKLEELKKKKEAPPAPEFSRRAQLIDVALRTGDSDYFAKSLVNQVWARLLGRGLVNPLDQMHPENPPSHPQLMNWLARDVQSHNYDIRRLIRGIVLSRAYARSSRWDSAAERPEDELFAVGSVRPLSPLQYATSLKLAGYHPAHLQGEQVGEEERAKRLDQIHAGARGLSNKFEMPGEGFQVGVTEALLFSNSDQIRKEIMRESGDSLIAHLKTLDDNNQLVEALMQNIHGRTPDAEERAALVAYLKSREDRRDKACKQLVWALLTSSELRFNY